jgi:E3 ubiquitin-protein ligase mind-bomb
VVWDNGVENLYRIGFEGMVDVKAITEAKGMSFYRDHLPFVGEDVQIPEGYYEVGDNVCVDCDSETVRFLQEGHGGWADGMREVMGLVGVVSGVDEDGDVVVQYSSGNRWTFNPIVLKKVVSSPTAETAPQRTSIGSMSFSGLLDQFLPGDVVRVSSDVDYVKRHQQGHGDWVDTMSIVSVLSIVCVCVCVCVL